MRFHRRARARGALATLVPRHLATRDRARTRRGRASRVDGDRVSGISRVETTRSRARRRTREEDARRLIDSFPIAIVLGLIDWFVVDTRGDS